MRYLRASDIFYRLFDAVAKMLFSGRFTCRLMPVYQRSRELLLYGFFGIGTLFISLLSYAFFSEQLHWNILISNAFSWVFATLFAFVTNRQYVFLNHRHGIYAAWVQLYGFAMGRFFTLVVEELLLYLLVGVLSLPNMYVKLFAQVVVIFLNYVISKLLVFRRKEQIRESKAGAQIDS